MKILLALAFAGVSACAATADGWVDVDLSYLLKSPPGGKQVRVYYYHQHATGYGKAATCVKRFNKALLKGSTSYHYVPPRAGPITQAAADDLKIQPCPYCFNEDGKPIDASGKVISD